jgi:hypothetical protein
LSRCFLYGNRNIVQILEDAVKFHKLGLSSRSYNLYIQCASQTKNGRGNFQTLTCFTT